MSEKTEQPTAKKLRDTRKKGDVAYSKDFTKTVLVLAIFGYLIASAASNVELLGQMILLPTTVMKMGFADAAEVVLTELTKAAMRLVLPIVGIVLILGIMTDALQVGFLVAFEKLKPSAKKLNVLANLKNIFSKKNLVEFLKSAIKISFLATLLWILIGDALPALIEIPMAGMAGLGELLGLLIKTMFVYIGVAYTIIAAADFLWQRFHYRKGLMMSKDEVKREYKEMEGDPYIKQKRKHLQMEMAQESAVSSAKKATVLVTNPTHLAVALFYDAEETPLPVVLATGEGMLAERMKRAAIEAGVPVMQNIPLAHALMEQATPGQFIPSELVEPVAELLRLLQQLDGNEETHQP